MNFGCTNEFFMYDSTSAIHKSSTMHGLISIDTGSVNYINSEQTAK